LQVRISDESVPLSEMAAADQTRGGNAQSCGLIEERVTSDPSAVAGPAPTRRLPTGASFTSGERKHDG
jgi:hypothetical protein